MLNDLKVLLKFGFDFSKQTAESLKDGWQGTDFFSFFDELMQLPAVLKSLPGAKEAVLNLTPEQKAELDKWIIETFDIPNDKLEAFIEHSLQMVTGGLSLISEWKSLKDEKPSEDAEKQA